jgi:uncharacterized cupin superfamily protein
VESVNLFEIPVRRDEDDPPGYDTGYVRLAEKLGAKKLGGTVYELPTGRSICPYHYEYGNEEWLIVLTGRPTLRTPEGERELSPGETVCFPEGPAGAHKVTNGGEETARVLMLSTKRSPDAAVYPDSGKMGIWTGHDAHPYRLFRIDSAVDYWDGETVPRPDVSGRR